MADFIALPLDHWHWWIAAVLMFLLEMALPGVFFLWLGLAAAITGVLVFAADLAGALPGWEVQAVVFAVLSVVSLTFAWKRRGRIVVAEDHATLNRRGEELVGRVVVVAVAIANGEGRVKVGDGLWLARGADQPVGAQVKIVGVDGTTLLVEPVAGFTEP